MNETQLLTAGEWDALDTACAVLHEEENQGHDLTGQPDELEVA